MECKHLTRFWTHIFSFWESLNNIYELSGHVHGYSYNSDDLYSCKDILIHINATILLCKTRNMKLHNYFNEMDMSNKYILQWLKQSSRKIPLRHHLRYNQNTFSRFLKSGEYIDLYTNVHYYKKKENIKRL